MYAIAEAIWIWCSPSNCYTSEKLVHPKKDGYEIIVLHHTIFMYYIKIKKMSKKINRWLILSFPGVALQTFFVKEISCVRVNCVSLLSIVIKKRIKKIDLLHIAQSVFVLVAPSFSITTLRINLQKSSHVCCRKCHLYKKIKKITSLKLKCPRTI